MATRHEVPGNTVITDFVLGFGENYANVLFFPLNTVVWLEKAVVRALQTVVLIQL